MRLFFCVTFAVASAFVRPIGGFVVSRKAPRSVASAPWSLAKDGSEFCRRESLLDDGNAVDIDEPRCEPTDGQRVPRRDIPRKIHSNSRRREYRIGRRLRRFGLSLTCSAVCLAACPPSQLPFQTASSYRWQSSTTASASATPAYEWDLMNGFVTLTEPTSLRFVDRRTDEQRTVQLTKPQLVGAGGGGAVFAFDQTSESQRDVLLKVSWERSAKTVRRECQTLQLLEDRNVAAAERCRAILPYPSDPSRVMILVEPYMRDAVASIAEIDNENARSVAVDQIVRTLVQMIAANVATIDVQPLISKTTGQTIFIDMTEAQTLSSSSDTGTDGIEQYSFLDKTLISSFCSEMVALVPERYWELAKRTIYDELGLMKERGAELSTRAIEVLEEQTPFLSD